MQIYEIFLFYKKENHLSLLACQLLPKKKKDKTRIREE